MLAALLLIFYQSDSPQDIFQRPTRPTRNDLSPHLLRNNLVWLEDTPIRARFRLDPLEIFNLAPPVFVILAEVVESLLILADMGFQKVATHVGAWYLRKPDICAILNDWVA